MLNRRNWSSVATAGPVPKPLFNCLQKGVSYCDDRLELCARQWPCSFCGFEDLPDDSIVFRGVVACSRCLMLIARLDDGLRTYRAEREACL
jgi:hypothetical protein